MPFTPFVAAPLPGWTLATVLALSLPLVWRRGRSGERECALALVFAVALDLAVQLFVPSAPIALAHTADNLLALPLITRSALPSVRTYPLVMAAAQLIAVIAHGLFWSGLINQNRSYPIILAIMGAVTLVALWTGCAQNRLLPNHRN